MIKKMGGERIFKKKEEAPSNYFWRKKNRGQNLPRKKKRHLRLLNGKKGKNLWIIYP